MAVIRDMTERERLRRFTENILATVPSGLVAIGKKSEILSVNRSFCELFGMKREDVEGQPVATVLQRIGLSEECRALVARRETFRNVECTCSIPGKGTVTLQLTLSGIRVEEEEALLVIDDITERKRVEMLQTRMSQVLESIAGDAALPQILEHLVCTIEEAIPDMKSSVLLLDADGRRLRHGAAPSLPDDYNAAVDGLLIGPGVGSCGTAAYERRLVIVEDIQTDPLWEDFRELASKHDLRACWSQPIIDSEGTVLGTFALYYHQPRRPTQTELELIALAAHIAGIAIRRKREEEKLQHQHQTLQALATVGRTLASSLDLDVILSRILDALGKLFGCSSSAVLLHDADAGTLTIVAQQGYKRPLIEDLVIHVETEGVTGLAVKERRVVYVPDVTKEPRYIKGSENVRSELAIPLMAAGYIIGVLDVQDEKVDAFDSEKIAVLAQFADYAAIAIENARLFQQTRWQLKELFVINEIMRLSQSGVGFEEVAKAAAEVLSQQFQYYSVTVFLRENDTAARRICSFGEGSALLPDTDVLPVNECLVGKVLETERPIVVNDLGQEPQFARWVGRTTQSRLCVPIKRGNVFIGAINVDSEKKYSFRSTDVATVSNIAAQLSAADERVRLLESLRASEHKYMSLYEDAPDMYHTQDENGVILMCNETFVRTLGYAKTDILGRSILEFVPEEFHASSMEAWAIVLKSGIAIDHECQLKKRDGSIIDVLTSARSEQWASGKKVFHVAMRDVTEKKRVERELAHFAGALSQTADSVMVTDRNGVIQYVNSAFEQTTGFLKDEVIGKTPRILKSGQHPREFYEEMWNTILAGKVYRGIFVNRRSTGDLFYEEKTITPVLDRFGKVVNFVSVGSNVTEQRKLEQQLAQVQKLETVGTLASGIAHDFNNILSGIGAYTELLERSGGEGRNALWYAKQIDQLKQRGEELTKLLLSFVRREELPFQAVNISDLVSEVALLANKTFPKTIEITVKTGAEPLWVQGNRTELYQVLLNLCINARDAMPKGGTLSIVAAKSFLPDKMQKLLMRRERATSSSVKIMVADTGTGIPFSVLNKIFDPFFTTKASGKGTGLGLSIAYNIVRNHNGFIDVQSEEGRGTTFTIILPDMGPPADDTASS